jgi:hypothetical protein
MRFVIKLVVLAGLVYAGKWIYDNFVSQSASSPPEPQRFGYDTPTGVDPAAKYERPGYEDKSFGQAVSQDMETSDRLVEEAKGDMEQAALRFRSVSAGAPAIERQEREPGS